MPYTFPVTLDQLRSNYTARKYPDIFETDEEWQALIDQATLELDKYAPKTVFATFFTAALATDYFIFDPTDVQTHIQVPNSDPPVYTALAANALSITDTYWNPGGDWSSLNIYSPGWQMLSQMILFTGSYFHNPSQMVVLRQKLDYWKSQFGDQGFDVIGEPGLPTSFLRLYPEPQEADQRVVVEFTQAYALGDIGQAWFRFFDMWFNFYICQAIADYFSESAGVQLLGFADSKAAMTYWQGRAEKAKDRAQRLTGGNQGFGERS